MTRKIQLERERLRLKIKQQEYEIKKSFLDVQRRFDPLQLGLNFVSDWLSGDDELDKIADAMTATDDPNLQKAIAEAGLQRQQRQQQVRRAADLLTNIYLALRNFIQMTFDGDDIGAGLEKKKPKKKRKPTTPKEYDEEDIYMIGRDDI